MKKNNKIKTVNNLKYRKVAYAISLLLLGGVLGCFISNFNTQPYDVNVTDKIRLEVCHNHSGLELSNIHITQKKGYKPEVTATVTNHDDYPAIKIEVKLGERKTFLNEFIAPHSSRTINSDWLLDMSIKKGKYLFCISSTKWVSSRDDIENLKEANSYIYEKYKEWFDSLSKEEQDKFMKLIEEE